jgi:hypothetical protein
MGFVTIDVVGAAKKGDIRFEAQRVLAIRGGFGAGVRYLAECCDPARRALNVSADLANADKPAVLRTRNGGEVFAVVSPSYAPVDADRVLLAAAPVLLISGLIVFGDAGPDQLWRESRNLVSRHIEHSEFTGLVLGTALVTSAVAAIAVGSAVRAGIAQAVRMAARKRRQNFASVRSAAPRSIGASS